MVEQGALRASRGDAGHRRRSIRGSASRALSAHEHDGQTGPGLAVPGEVPGAVLRPGVRVRGTGQPTHHIHTQGAEQG